MAWRPGEGGVGELCVGLFGGFGRFGELGRAGEGLAALNAEFALCEFETFGFEGENFVDTFAVLQI